MTTATRKSISSVAAPQQPLSSLLSQKNFPSGNTAAQSKLRRCSTVSPSIQPMDPGSLPWLGRPSYYMHQEPHIDVSLHLTLRLLPGGLKALLKKANLKQLPENIPHAPHLEPRYNLWEQRLCLCPEGEFFKAMRAGKASVVTDTITTVSKIGTQLASLNRL